MKDSKWIRFRFKTNSVHDCRPIVFNPKYPWWCSGYGDDCAVIVAWLPEDEELSKYWDDAYDVEGERFDSITFSGRFPKPSYFVES